MGRGCRRPEQKALDFLGRGRFAEKISLPIVAAFTLKEIPLGGSFYALGDDPQTQVFGKSNDGARDGDVVRIAGNLGAECTIDLQSMDREILR